MSNPAAIALALPDVEEGVSCAGTALESRTFRVKQKAFLFVSKKELRLKLAASLADAKKRGFEAGAGGWVKLPLEELPGDAILKAWIRESHALFAGTPRAKTPRRQKS